MRDDRNRIAGTWTTAYNENCQEDQSFWRLPETSRGVGKMIIIAICDDGPEDAERLKKFCDRYFAGGYEYAVRTYASGREFLEDQEEKGEQRSTLADILLLDIEMEGMDGIAVKKYLAQRHAQTKILFVTSHDEYLSEGYGLQVFGYLMKPVQYENFLEKMNEIKDSLDADSRFVELIGAREKVFLKNINYLEAFQRGTYFFLKREEEKEGVAGKGIVRILDAKSFGYWMRILEELDKNFILVKRGRLVNLANVAWITAKENGCAQIRFDDGSSTSTNTRRGTAVRKRYDQYIRERAR